MMTLLAALVATLIQTGGDAPGSIVFYRGSTVWGAAGACPIRHEGREVVELGRGKYAEWPIKPGRYVLSNKRSSIEVNVAPGEIRYVRCQIRNGMFEGGAELQIVSAEDFEKRKSDFERKEIVGQ